ncbi:hypothetical protein NQ317_008637 [Molorchus minor]|uniref:Cytokine-inducible SH2-containing protein n=1 Tax=Molorchus minor TaxID=1323400 RepID=A0ABQ9K008_9CUCU|nr:hypothetical protein NQ317_008637 [Molorchus minor]
MIFIVVANDLLSLLQTDSPRRAWHAPAMLGCSTVCPNCKHEFQCCQPAQLCCDARRSLHALSGGGLVTALAPPSSSCTSPQVSPSAQLSFILPPFATPLQLAQPPLDSKPETELQRLSDTVRALRQSDWYYEGITYQQSHDLLADTAVGTYLVRNSSDPRFLFSLSVQTERGPTSVRLFYMNGFFRLDAQAHLQSAMPLFPSVITLVQHYVEQSRLCRNSAQVWVDPNGKWYSSILLDKPLRKKQKPPSLKHFARLAVHRALRSSDRPRLAMLPPPHTQLELPSSLTAYLSEYPYSI